MVISPLAGSHILLALSTYIIGDIPFPEYSVVVLLDDIPLIYYDSNTKKLIYRNYESYHEEEEQHDATFIFLRDYNSLKKRALFARQRINISDGNSMGLCINLPAFLTNFYGDICELIETS